ncbi:lysophospholipase [Puia dinghuensis]|uniref:Lysophospholipase n=1 Tax=Puia dinghuensis TaxID=1792502 RepID=A0A8J2U9P6_9BACT|nr:lysophospholipase [Puia dinghuensis]
MASYLALGDSYTIGEAVDSNDRYPVQALHLIADARPEIIATTGWTTGNLLDALAAARPAGDYQAVSLLIGVNNQYQGRSQAEYREQFIALLKAAIGLAGNRPSHVLVLSIPDYSVTPFARKGNTARIAAQIDSFNAINSGIAAMYKVNYLDVTTESRKAGADPSLIAADGLHFSGKEYAIWARLMEPWLSTTLAQR